MLGLISYRKQLAENETLLIAIEMEHVAGLEITGEHSESFYQICFV